jgi:hypothetical protein
MAALWAGWLVDGVAIEEAETYAIIIHNININIYIYLYNSLFPFISHILYIYTVYVVFALCEEVQGMYYTVRWQRHI